MLACLLRKEASRTPTGTAENSVKSRPPFYSPSWRARVCATICFLACLAWSVSPALAADGTPGNAGTNDDTREPAVGGSGADGGAGSDGASPGKGGAGGKAGSASAIGTTSAANGTATAIATGGIPGAGGRSGDGGGNGNVGGAAGVANPNGATTDAGNALAETEATNGGSTKSTATGGGPNLDPQNAATRAAGGRGGNASQNGGVGGTGAEGGDATAFATTRGGAGTSEATTTGGRGGQGGLGGTANSPTAAFGGAGGVGGNGGDARSVAMTAGAGSSTATATGGNGGGGGSGGNGIGARGAAGGRGGDGGVGGIGRAEATTGNGTNATAEAVGGDGGNAGVGGQGQNPILNGADGKAGAGQLATAIAKSTNLAGDTTARAMASGGDGGGRGTNSTPIIGTAGSASAAADATATGNAFAPAFAETGLGRGGTAIAGGIANGASGEVIDNADATSNPGRAGKARAMANSPIPAGAMGAVSGQAQAAIAASLPMLKPNTTLNSFASAIEEPLPADVLSTSLGKPNVLAGLGIGNGGNALALAALGALYPSLGSGASTVYRSSVEFVVDRTGLLNTELLVGLQDGQATGAGFDSLRFAITKDGNLTLDRIFTSVSSALAFFDDRVLDLGSITPDESGVLDLQFDLAVTAHNAGDGFAIDLAVAAVPEPSTLLMVLTCVMMVIGVGLLRRRAHADSELRNVS